MALLNVLKGSWEGKLGQTVGSKWKNKSTIRSYTKPTDPHSPAQTAQRDSFGYWSKFISLFSDQLKILSPLDTNGMSVRNAIIKLNKEIIAAGDTDYTLLKVSRGGLPAPTNFDITTTTLPGPMVITWDRPTAVNISSKCKLVYIVVNVEDLYARVGSVLASAGTVTIQVPSPGGQDNLVFAYFLDYRGSTKVGSTNVFETYMP